MLIFKEQIHCLGHLVSGTSILPLTDKIEALMKLKPSTNIKEVRHFLVLTSYYRKFICNYLDITHPLNCLMWKSQPLFCTPECQSSFNMLCSRLANALIKQLPHHNKLYLLFTDESKFCYLGVLTQASTIKSNKALIKLLTDSDPPESVNSQTQEIQQDSVVNPVAYISCSFTKTQCRWPAITKEYFSIFMSIKKCSFYLQNLNWLVYSHHKPLLTILQEILIMKNVTHQTSKPQISPGVLKYNTLRE